MYHVKKRDNKIVDFDLTKISNAIQMAFEACEVNFHPSIIDFLALRVTADFEPKIKDGLIAVEDIQDSVESVLIQGGYAEVADLPEQLARVRLEQRFAAGQHHAVQQSAPLI